MEVNSLLGEAAALKVESFVEEDDKAKSKYGLVNPKETLEILSGGKSYFLALGNETAGGDDVFAWRRGVPKIFTLAKSSLKPLRKSFTDLKQPPPTPTPMPTPTVAAAAGATPTAGTK